jgi:hypothetical protein
MKNKSLSLFVFAIFSFAILASFASATVTFTTPIFSSNNTFTVTASDTSLSGTEIVSSLVSTLTDSFGTNYTITPVTDFVTFDSSNSSTLTQTLTYSIPSGFSFQSTKSLASFSLTGTHANALSYTFPNQPQEVSSCQLTGKTNSPNHLDVSLDSIKVSSGYGSGTDWYPLDTIQAKVTLTNNGADTIKNAVVKWMLYDTTAKKKIISGSENSVSVKDDSDKQLTIEFKLDTISNLKSGDNYVLYVWATGNDEYYSGNPATCYDDLQSVNVNIDSHFVVLDSMNIPDSASCGSTIQITGTAWNIGDEDESNVYLWVTNTQLGINQRINLGDISQEDSRDVSFSINVPDDSATGTYALNVQVYDDSGSIFKNDNGDQSQTQLILNLNNTCSTTPKVSIAAALSGTAQAGNEVDVKATIANTGSTTKTFTLSLGSYSTWASSATLSQTSITLASGASQDVVIKLQTNKDSTGDQQFNVVVNDGSKVLSQPVKVTLTSASIFPSITGFFSNLSGGNNSWYIWGIVALNVILIIVIIAVAVRVVKKK